MSYEIEFLKPRILPGSGGNFNGSGVFDHFQIFNTATQTTGVLPVSPFGTQTQPIYPTSESTLGGVVTGAICPASTFGPAALPTGNNFLGGIPTLNGSGQPTGTLGPSGTNTYYFPPGVSSGVYYIGYICRYTNNPANNTLTETMTNCQAYDLFAGAGGVANSIDFANKGIIVGVYNICWMFTKIVTHTNASFTWSFQVAIGGQTGPIGCDLFVIYMGPSAN